MGGVYRASNLVLLEQEVIPSEITEVTFLNERGLFCVLLVKAVPLLLWAWGQLPGQRIGRSLSVGQSLAL